MATPMTSPPNISVRDDPEQSRYEAVADSGDVVGFLEYERYPDRIVLVHTEVLPGHEGEGVGSALVDEVLDRVAKENLRVVPVCPFVKKQLASR